jgi:O-antigen ligase
MQPSNKSAYGPDAPGSGWLERLRNYLPPDLDAPFLALVFVVPIFATLLMARGALGMGLAIAALVVVGLVGTVLVRRMPIESLAAWLMIPVILLFPPSKSQFGGLPSINSIRTFDILLLIGVLYLNRSRDDLERPSLRTWVFRGLSVLLILITGASALIYNDLTSDSWGTWQTGPLLVLAAGFLGSFLGSPKTLLEKMSEIARPVAFLLCAVAVFEYTTNSSIYGLYFRSIGFDRRPPGPFLAAEVLGYMFSVLAALILFHKRQVKAPGSGLVNNLALVACLVGAVLTFFRSSWLSVLAVLLIDFLLHLPSRRQVGRLVPWIPFLLPLVAVLAVTTGYIISSSGRALDDNPFIDAIFERTNGDSSQNSAGNRDSFARSAYRMIEFSPLTGVGFNQFPINLYRFLPEDIDADQFVTVFQSVDSTTANGNVAHNSFVQLAAECGIPTAIILIALVLYPAAALFRQRNRPNQKEYFALAMTLLAGLFTSYMSQSMFYYGALALLWSSLAFGALVRRADDEPSWNWDGVNMPLMPVMETPEEKITRA